MDLARILQIQEETTATVPWPPLHLRVYRRMCPLEKLSRHWHGKADDVFVRHVLRYQTSTINCRAGPLGRRFPGEPNSEHIICDAHVHGTLRKEPSPHHLPRVEDTAQELIGFQHISTRRSKLSTGIASRRERRGGPHCTAIYLDPSLDSGTRQGQFTMPRSPRSRKHGPAEECVFAQRLWTRSRVVSPV